MATSSFQKNFYVTQKQRENVVSVMTSDNLGAVISNDFKSKFEKVKSNHDLFSNIFTKKIK
ncbi:hypothetical protein QJV03_01945 [Listeria swaminathanii]|uniref:Uncharacterized protein n=1 Tax=Listeria swaminathanii TaxID=2713501 RepID=A0ABU2IDK3_9LIST|nr:MULTISPECIES: hypothetical protein [Listeria]ECC1497431.1 hypothetical protein [Listeria monocytogenes]EGK9405349.1 hypothetical protein [Listeria monocytogenes]MBC2011813.1 hypothetical protein [Listeria marthii]MBF2516126.1 hypothetical protein [Listeria marthii]MDT0015947.1 hypothetical protein [Listeria swaminathanii]